MHKSLASLLPTDTIPELDAFDDSATSISLPDNTCNNPKCSALDFYRFTRVTKIIIGDDSFENLMEFRMDGIQQLKTLKIGKNSFTKEKKRHGDDGGRSFHIVNCENLESIEIGIYSFCDYSGEVEFKNLPKLRSLRIGSHQDDSWNFDYASLVLRGCIELDP